jgi:hypothetical protein
MAVHAILAGCTDASAAVWPLSHRPVGALLVRAGDRPDPLAHCNALPAVPRSHIVCMRAYIALRRHSLRIVPRVQSAAAPGIVRLGRRIGAGSVEAGHVSDRGRWLRAGGSA